MKLRKILSAVIAGALCMGALAVSASAATFDLPVPAYDIGSTQVEWPTNVEGNAPIGVLSSATHLVVEGAEPFTEELLEGGTGVIVLFGDGQPNGWDWNAGSTNYVSTDHLVDGKLVFDLTQMNGYSDLKNSEISTIAFCSWAPDFDMLQLKRIYLDGVSDDAIGGGASTDTVAAGDTDAASTTNKGSAETGVEGVAVIAGLAILAAGAAVISKKRK